MPKTLVFKASFSILICLIMFAAMAYSVFAEEATTGATNRKLNIPQKINIREAKIENKIEGLREKRASKEAALKEKLKTFKDQKKATISARLSANLNQINENQTAQMQKHLSGMSKILDRLEAKLTDKTAITNARNTIATVSAAVTTQSQKDYTIQVTSEGRIGLDAKKQRDQLHADLLAVRKLVIDAKQSVADAIRIAKSGPAPVGAGSEKEGTASGKQ